MNTRFITKTLLALPSSLGIALGLFALNRELAIGAKFDYSYMGVQQPFQPLATSFQQSGFKGVSATSAAPLPLSAASPYTSLSQPLEAHSEPLVSHLLFQPIAEPFSFDWYFANNESASFQGEIKTIRLEEESAQCSSRAAIENENHPTQSTTSEAQETLQHFNTPKPDMTQAFENYIHSVSSSGMEWAF